MSLDGARERCVVLQCCIITCCDRIIDSLCAFIFVYATAGPTLYALKMLKPSKAVVTTHPGI